LANLLPFLGIAFGSNTKSSVILNNPQGGGMNRAFGAAATVGLTVAILKFVVDSNKVAADEKSNDNSAHHEAIKQLLNRSEFLFRVVRTFLRSMLQNGHQQEKVDYGSSEDEGDDEQEEDNEPMIHKGSCHCRSVSFEVSTK
jgi:hypothetical protein